MPPVTDAQPWPERSSQAARWLDDGFREVVEHTAQLVRRGTEGEEDHLVGTDVAVALHQVEIGGPQVRADGDLHVAPRPPPARQAAVEDGEAIRQRRRARG